MKGSMYDWLPDRHLGVAATLSHADDLIGQVGDLLIAYHTQADGIVGLREILAGSVSQTVVDRVAPMPRKVPLLAADALVALRAALEHVLFAEVEFLDGAPLDEKAAKLVEMPASHSYEKFEEWTKKRVRNGPPSLQPGSELVRRIDGLQPFHRTVEPQMHPLALLVLHTNHAKHRTPAITAVRLAAMYQDDQLPRSIHELPERPEKPLRVGDVIAETPLGTKVPITFFPNVGINRPSTGRWPELMRELGAISDWVRTQAVPRLVTGMEPTEPSLPARYEMAVGHEDERRAISLGSTTPAVDLFTQRLTAAAARVGLVDLITQVDPSLGCEQVSAWARQLPDAEVLDRMAQLKSTRTYNRATMLRNEEVMNGLCDEARDFDQDDQPAV